MKTQEYIDILSQLAGGAHVLYRSPRRRLQQIQNQCEIYQNLPSPDPFCTNCPSDVDYLKCTRRFLVRAEMDCDQNWKLH